MKNLILILAIAFIAMFSSLNAEEEILWKSRYNMIIDKNGDIDPGYIYNAIFTPDDKYIIVSCERRTFLVESETGKYVRDLQDIAGVIRFSNDGKYIYTHDNKKYNYETMELVGEFKNKGEKLPIFYKVDVCEKAGVMIGIVYNTNYNQWNPDIYVCDLNKMELIEQIGDTNNYYYNLQVAQNGKFFTVTSEDRTDKMSVKYVNYAWDTKLRKKMFQNNSIGHFRTSPDEKWIGAVSGGQVSLFDTEKYEKIWEMAQSVGGALTGVAFSPDSKYLATGTSGADVDISDIHIWNVETGKLSFRYSNARKNITASPNYNYSNSGTYILGWSSQSLVVYNAIYTTTNVDPIINNDTLQVYPSPSSKKITIEINGILSYSLKVVNQVGKEYHTISNLENSKLEIDISNLENGNYYLVLMQNNISKLYKFIKE